MILGVLSLIIMFIVFKYLPKNYKLLTKYIISLACIFVPCLIYILLDAFTGYFPFEMELISIKVFHTIAFTLIYDRNNSWYIWLMRIICVVGYFIAYIFISSNIILFIIINIISFIIELISLFINKKESKLV